jgi:hypothetical protein
MGSDPQPGGAASAWYTCLIGMGLADPAVNPVFEHPVFAPRNDSS